MSWAPTGRVRHCCTTVLLIRYWDCCGVNKTTVNGTILSQRHFNTTKKGVTYWSSWYLPLDILYRGQTPTTQQSCHPRPFSSVLLLLGCLPNLVGLGFLQSVSYIKSIPTHEKIICCGKNWPTWPSQTSFFLGWVGLGLGSLSVSQSYLCFTTEQKFV